MTTGSLANLTYTEGYDLGAEDCYDGKPQRVQIARRATAAPGSLGYVDGYNDGREWGLAADGESDRRYEDPARR